MVFSDDFLHFLMIKKEKKSRIHQNYLVALTFSFDISELCFWMEYIQTNFISLW